MDQSATAEKIPIVAKLPNGTTITVDVTMAEQDTTPCTIDCALFDWDSTRGEIFIDYIAFTQNEETEMKSTCRRELYRIHISDIILICSAEPNVTTTENYSTSSLNTSTESNTTTAIVTLSGHVTKVTNSAPTSSISTITRANEGVVIYTKLLELETFLNFPS